MATNKRKFDLSLEETGTRDSQAITVEVDEPDSIETVQESLNQEITQAEESTEERIRRLEQELESQRHENNEYRSIMRELKVLERADSPYSIHKNFKEKPLVERRNEIIKAFYRNEMDEEMYRELIRTDRQIDQLRQKEEGVQIKKSRIIRNDIGKRLVLDYTPRPGYHRHFFKDNDSLDGARFSEAELLGYSPVMDSDGQGKCSNDGAVGNPSQLGSSVVRDGKNGTRLKLFEIPIEMYRKRQQMKDEQNKNTSIDALSNSLIPGDAPQSEHGGMFVPEHGGVQVIG